MTCNCKAEIEAALTERFKANTPEAHDHEVELEGYGFSVVGNTLVMRPFMPYTSSATFPLKKGGEKAKKLKGTMVFNYCPFCGEKQ